MLPLVRKKGQTIPDADHKPKFWSPVVVVVLTIAIYFATQLVLGIIVALYAGFRHWSGAETKIWLTNSIPVQFVVVLVVEALTIGAVYLLLKRRGFTMKKIGLAWPTAKDAIYAIAGMVVYYAIFVCVLLLVKQIVPSLNVDQKQQLGFDGVSTGWQLSLTFVSLVLLPPIAEEILVRGFLYTGLRSRLKFIPALLLTSVIFATAHLQFGSGAPLLWAAFIDTFILSATLVYLREKRGTLGAPMILHMLKNSIAFAVLFIFAVH